MRRITKTLLIAGTLVGIGAGLWVTYKHYDDKHYIVEGVVVVNMSVASFSSSTDAELAELINVPPPADNQLTVGGIIRKSGGVSGRWVIYPRNAAAKFRVDCKHWGREAAIEKAHAAMRVFIAKNTELEPRIATFDVLSFGPNGFEESVRLDPGDGSPQNPPSLKKPSVALGNAPPFKWREFRSDEGRFQVEFHSEPEPWDSKYESPKFGKVSVHHIGAQHGDTMLCVTYSDYPRELSQPEVQEELKHVHTLPGTGAEILETLNTNVGELPAIQSATKHGPVFMVQRHFIHNNRRLYSLQFGSARDPRHDQEKLDHFFNSFSLQRPIGPLNNKQ